MLSKQQKLSTQRFSALHLRRHVGKHRAAVAPVNTRRLSAVGRQHHAADKPVNNAYTLLISHLDMLPQTDEWHMHEFIQTMTTKSL